MNMVLIIAKYAFVCLFIFVIKIVVVQSDWFGVDRDTFKDATEIEIKHHDTRNHRSARGIQEVLSIEIPVHDNTTINLSLRRNSHISHLVPVTVERNGHILAQSLKGDQTVGYFYDTDKGASFMVRPRRTGLHFLGVFNVGRQVYLVQPPDEVSERHTISTAPYMTVPHDTDIERSLTEEYSPFLQTESERKLTKRFLSTVVYEIEILMVVDYSVYSFWKGRAKGSTKMEQDLDAKKRLREYYALVLNAMDLRYKSVTGRGYNMKLLFAGLHIADTPAGASWTENIKNMASHHPKVNSSVALDQFKLWENHHVRSLPGHDHAMLITKYDLESTGPHDNLGRAFLGGLCGEYDVSVIEDTFAATVATTASHELGHNLNSDHDGEGNNCPAGDGYIMDAIMDVGNDTTFNKKLWKFSNCSLDYFDAFIKTLDRQHSNCMRTRSASYNASGFSEFTGELLGQIYDPDSQCEAVNGKGSYMCRQTLDFDYSRICGDMDCSMLANNGTCLIEIPWSGTSCGDGKLCYDGSCVPSTVAPKNVSETCLFGDQPGHVAKRGKTCHDLIGVDSHHYECYNYDEECCETCANVSKLYTTLPGCTYGDKAIWCGNLTSDECYLNNDTCCATCSRYATGVQGCMYGDKQTWCKTLTARECYSNDVECCSKCKQFQTAITGCRYGDKADWCRTLKAHECYANDDNCCSLCKQWHTGISGCEYGDRDPTCKPSECSTYDHHSQTVVCCKSCSRTAAPILG